MTRSFLLRRVIPGLLAAAAVALAVVTIDRDRVALGHALDRIGPAPIIVSVLCAFVGTAAVAEIWREVLIGLDAHVPVAPSARVFLTSQIGKYLPGSVWPVLAQMQFGRVIGISRRRIFTGNALMTVLNLALGLVVAGICLPLSSKDALQRYWWAFLFLPLLVLCLHPRAIPGVLDRVFALAHREPLDVRLPVRASLRASSWGLLNWLGLGLQIYVLARPFGATGVSALLAAIGGMALAVCAGILFIPAPAGAGVRDAVLLATLVPTIGHTNALAVVLVSRVSLIVVDLLLAGLAQLLPRGTASVVQPADESIS